MAADYELPEVYITGGYTGGAFTPFDWGESRSRRFRYIAAPPRGPGRYEEVAKDPDYITEAPAPAAAPVSSSETVQAFAPVMPEVLPEVIITAPRVVPPPPPAALPLRIGTAIGRAGLGLIALLLTPMPSGGPRTGERRDPPRPRKPQAPGADDPLPNWDELIGDPAHPWTPTQPYIPLPELPEVIITAPRSRPLELPFYEPFRFPAPGRTTRPGRRPAPTTAPSRRTAPRRAPQPTGTPGSEFDPRAAPFTFTPGFPAPGTLPWSPTAPDVFADPRPSTAPRAPSSPSPSPPFPSIPSPGPTGSPGLDVAPSWDVKPPNKSDRCSCPKPKKKKKKEKKDRAECFEFKVRQLARGQLTFNRKLIACETRDAYNLTKPKPKKPKYPKPGTNPFPSLWS